MTGTQHAGIVMGSSGVVRFNQFAECYLSRLLTALTEYLIVYYKLSILVYFSHRAYQTFIKAEHENWMDMLPSRSTLGYTTDD